MKKNLFIIIAIIVNSACCIINSAFAQAPGAIPYQAVARNSSGAIIANQNVSLRFTIHDAPIGGTILFQETHFWPIFALDAAKYASAPRFVRRNETANDRAGAQG